MDIGHPSKRAEDKQISFEGSKKGEAHIDERRRMKKERIFN